MTRHKEIAIVGAGFSGSVLAHKLALDGYKLVVYESRDHIAGNCYTERDPDTSVMVHKYGPHIFHTNNETVWEFVNRFDRFMPYVNRVKATVNSRVYTLPINLLTINQFFGKTLRPEHAKAFICSLSDKTIDEPTSFEEQALKFIGKELYEAFFKGYTIKQWGRNPSELPASILKRLPVRFNYDDNYFAHHFQGMPQHGYTHIAEQWLDHKNIELRLNTPFQRKFKRDYYHTFYTGSLDAYFDCSLGDLGYRTLEFEIIRESGDYQGCAVMNYCDEDVPYTRITEHKYFSPWETHENTLCFREFSREFRKGDIPYYPIRLVDEKAMLGHYVALAKAEDAVSFVGRLATYRYLDMDNAIAEALEAFKNFKHIHDSGNCLPSFFVDVI